MILQKSFWNAELLSVLLIYVLLINMLIYSETVVLLNIFLEPVTFFFDSLINKKLKRTAFIQNRNIF